MLYYNCSKGQGKSRGDKQKRLADDNPSEAEFYDNLLEKIFQKSLKNLLTILKTYGTINTEKRERNS